jgi:hypothetical protein
MMPVLYQASMLSWNFITLAHRNNSPQSEMSLQPDTLSRFRQSDMFGYKIQNTVYISYESFHVVLFIFIGINFRGLAKSEMFADIFICGFDTCK